MHLPEIGTRPNGNHRSWKYYFRIISLTLLCLIGFFGVVGVLYRPVIALFALISSSLHSSKEIDWTLICPLPPLLEPPSQDLGLKNASIFLTDEYQKKSAYILGGAIRIPTQSFDDMDQDPRKESRFEVFNKFHEFLASTFPNVTKHLEIVNTYGLLYTIQGKSNEKPLILMAHQDVVPVEQSTLNDWKFPAFSGHFDGKLVWGRGSADTKSSLIAILEATEALLSQHWIPNRTVLISFGFDEELDGSRGALSLANAVRSRYGESDSVYMIVDEGTSIVSEMNSLFAVIGVSEKGYADINITVKTPGGHSSDPPDHTGIGIISDIITQLEMSHIKRNAYHLDKEDVVAHEYSCYARYGNFENTDETRKSYIDTEKLSSIFSNSREYRPLIGTTQAIDVVSGGVKINALPEQVSTVVNYRIDVRESVSEVTSRLVKIVDNVAAKYNMGVRLNGKPLHETSSHGVIEVSNGQSIEPSLISPYNPEDEQWGLLVGSTKHALSEWFNYDVVAAAPSMMTGNTDTWQYQGLTNHIYRYTPSTPNSSANAHTVNEYISLEGHLSTLVWYYELLQFM